MTKNAQEYGASGPWPRETGATMHDLTDATAHDGMEKGPFKLIG